MSTESNTVMYQTVEEIFAKEGLPEEIKTEVHLWDEILKKEFFVMPQHMLPLITEAHGKVYAPGTTTEPVASEYSVERSPSGEITSVRADSMLRVNGTDVYHFECEIKMDATIILRVIEYSVQEALAHAEKLRSIEGESEIYQIRFPRSAVMLLQNKRHMPSEFICKMILPDDYIYTYRIPTIRVQDYTLDEIREKKLYPLIPFLPIRFRKELEKEHPNIKKILQDVKIFYNGIIAMLDEAMDRDELSETNYKSVLLSLLRKSLLRVFSKNEQLLTEVNKMSMPLLELEFEKIERLENELDKKDVELNKKDVELDKKDDELNKKDVELKVLRSLLKKHHIEIPS